MPYTEPRVSVVVPVYNAMPYLRELLDSLVAQDLAATSFNVIVVDDASTDGSSELLEEYVRRQHNLDVIHRTNRESPGSARNLGLQRSTGTYVFFADADDVVGRECLRRLVNFAEAHDSDVVIPRMVPLGGRGFPRSVYDRTLIDADLPTAFKTLFPQKLYRRRMLSDHDVTFGEGWMEDGIFNARAYVHAKRISIVSDYDYYFLRGRPDGLNLSKRTRDPMEYTASLMEICRIVREDVRDPAAADEIVLDLYSRKCLHLYEPRRFARYDEGTQRRWMSAHKIFVDHFVTETMERRLESPLRERSYFVRREDWLGMRAAGEQAADPRMDGTIAGARWSEGGVEILVNAAIQGRLQLPRQLICEVRGRDGDGASAFPLVREEAEAPPYGKAARYKGVFPPASIAALMDGMYDVHLVSISAGERFSSRLAWGQHAPEPSRRAGFRIYATKGGHAVVEKRAQGAPVDVALRKAFGRVATALRLRR